MGETAWSANHPVLEALRRRRAAVDAPGSRSDGLKIGLAVEGGGIRGVISAAMLSALEDLGLTSAFDAVYAASAGAINGAYYVLGGTWYQLPIYYDDLSTRQFVDFRRAARGRILDLGYAFDVVLDQVKPLDYAAVLDSPVPLHVAVTLVDELRTETVSEFTSPSDLRHALLASSWLPVATRGTAEFRGRRAVDGGVLTPHPYQLALDDGCTHVLSLSTRPIRPPRDGHTLPQRFAAQRLDRLRRGLGSGYLDALAGYRHDRRALQAWMNDPPERPPYVLDLAPLPWMPEVKRHELDPGRILAGARGAYEVMHCAVQGLDPAHIPTGRLRAVPRLTMVDRATV